MTPCSKDERLRYVLSVLLDSDPKCFQWPTWLNYGNQSSIRDNTHIHIVASGYFGPSYGVEASLPTLPLREIDGTPLLYGDPRLERNGNYLVVHADILASAYFLLTRYEEVIRRDVRDEHGRFPGRESLPFLAGFLHRPIVDEYSALLRKWLHMLGIEIPSRSRGISKIYLTHDVDEPYAWRTLRTSIRAMPTRFVGNPLKVFDPLLSYYGLRHEVDPRDCFQWILGQDTSLRAELGPDRVESVFFFLAGGIHRHDGMPYLDDRRIRWLFEAIRRSEARVGLHSSYSAGGEPLRVGSERQALCSASDLNITWNRHHFLRSCEPENMAALETAGITDDFTLGYADVAGFRMGTCRSFQWFDPVAMRLSNLTVHPMTMMECTLDSAKYMGLSFGEARAVCYQLLAQVALHGGEAVLLWHNTQLSEAAAAAGIYHRRLYQEILDMLGKRV